MNQVLYQKIADRVKRAKAHGISKRELFSCCHIRPRQNREFAECLARLEQKHVVFFTDRRFVHRDFLPVREATVTRLNKTYGFARFTDDDSTVFIPGRYFKGAMPGDKILVTPIESKGNSPEGAVAKILKEGDSSFTGTLVNSDDGTYIHPDGMIRYNIRVRSRDMGGAKAGEKVICRIAKRGDSHAGHTVEVTKSFGDGQTAVNCAEAVLELNGISHEFESGVSAEANRLAEKGISPHDLEGRTDLRKEILFTIDSADSKDLDDAVSLKRTDEGYELGVHIADVSHYVRPNSALDKEAYRRGTSIYFADRVVPMLPPALSNGICSLNPREDRLAFSCIMQVGRDGSLQGYSFQKSVIRSAVKGVYKEINSILNHGESEEIAQKYAGLTDRIFLMKELADILTANKRRRGAPEIETSESYILLDENSKAVGIVPRDRGESEVIIEEFMLMANEAAATFARESGIPFVYRVHEPPSEEKIENLRAVMEALGINTSRIKVGMPPAVLSSLLEEAKGRPYSPIVNRIVLRTMSKAKYLEQPIGHYGLALKNYAHFTSPIRRYPDLTIHRILTDVVSGVPADKIKSRYEVFAGQSARQSSTAEQDAMQLERECSACYKAEYMKAHIGEEYDGIISSVAPHGIYVELPNTVEGLLRLEALPAGGYDFDGMIEYKNRQTGQTYRIGDPIRVRCSAADVSAGNIDFALCESISVE